MDILSLGKQVSKLNLVCSISDWKFMDRRRFISGVLNLFSTYQNLKMDYFWGDENEESVIYEWTKALQHFSYTTIRQNLELILDGRYQNGHNKVPKSPGDFKNFILNGSHMKMSDSSDNADYNKLDCDKEKPQEVSVKNAEEALKNIRAAIKNPRTNTELDEDYLKARAARYAPGQTEPTPE